MNDRSRDPIFRLPRSRSARLLVGLAGLVVFSVAAVCEFVLLGPETVTFKDRAGIERTAIRSERWPAAALWAIVMALGPAMAISTARSSPLEIREDGIKLERKDRKVFTWDQIESCHWGRHLPGTLNIHHAGGLASIPVPEPYRLEVEAALRRFTRWQD